MKITLHGAAGDVTGSADLVETDRARVLVDFGLFQGGTRQPSKNVLPSRLDPQHLHAVLVTHAHLDHVGRLALLVKSDYQGEGTLGRQLVDGAKKAKIFGETVAVKARIHNLNGFSAHAGQSALLKWCGHLAPSKPKVVLTHGEARGREPLAALIKQRHGLRPVFPVPGDVLEV